MGVIKKYNPGEFCWTDLGTTDVAGATKFYQGLFGWKMQDFPMGVGDAKYSMCCIGGKKICALYPMFEDQRKMKCPPSWLPYIAVKSVTATVTKAKAAGGKVCMEPMNVMDKGRMAVIHDPTRAAFAIWQAKAHPGAGLDDKPGTVCWHDLNTPKTAAAGKFYAKVFGWEMREKDFSGNEYHLFTLGKEPVCGMWPKPHPKLPPCWLTHWEVEDCVKTVAKAKRLGGRVIMGTTEVHDICHFAVLTDPQGAAFGIIGV